MRNAIFIIVLFLTIGLFPTDTNGQTDREKPVTVTQGFVDDATKAFIELPALRGTVQKLLAERKLSEDERKVTVSLLEGIDKILALKDRTISDYTKLSELQMRIIDMQQRIIEKLETALNKPKSSFSKFLKVLKEVSLVIGGILIGRGASF